MGESQGVLMTDALMAVKQMHSDCSRMLRDLDRWMDGYKSVYGSVATMDLSYDVKNGLYMAEGLLRHYVRPDFPAEVLALNIVFFDQRLEVTQPLLIVAKIVYASPLESIPDRGKGWDPWSAYLVWNKERVFDKVIELAGPLKKDTVLKVATAAMPLFEITSESVLQTFLQKIRDHSFEASSLGAVS